MPQRKPSPEGLGADTEWPSAAGAPPFYSPCVAATALPLNRRLSPSPGWAYV
jgi:hypothetical protein